MQCLFVGDQIRVPGLAGPFIGTYREAGCGTWRRQDHPDFASIDNARLKVSRPRSCQVQRFVIAGLKPREKSNEGGLSLRNCISRV